MGKCKNKLITFGALSIICAFSSLSLVSVYESQNYETKMIENFKEDTRKNTTYNNYVSKKDVIVSTLLEANQFSKYLNLVKGATYYKPFEISILNKYNDAYEECNFIKEKFPNCNVINDDIFYDSKDIGFKVNGELHNMNFKIEKSGTYKISVWNVKTDERGIVKPVRQITNETFTINLNLDFAPKIKNDVFYAKHYGNFNKFYEDILSRFSEKVVIKNQEELKKEYSAQYSSEKKKDFVLKFSYENFDYEQIIHFDKIDKTTFLNSKEEIFKNIPKINYSFLSENINLYGKVPSLYFEENLKFADKLSKGNGQLFDVNYVGEPFNVSNIVKPENFFLEYKVTDTFTNDVYSYVGSGLIYPKQFLINNFSKLKPHVSFSKIKVKNNISFENLKREILNNLSDLCLVGELEGKNVKDYSFNEDNFTFNIEKQDYISKIGKMNFNVYVKFQFEDLVSEVKLPVEVEFVDSYEVKLLTKYNKIILNDIEDVKYRTEQVIIIDSLGNIVDGVNKFNDKNNAIYKTIDYKITDNRTIIISLKLNDDTIITKEVQYIFTPKVDNFKKILIKYGNFLRGIF